LWCRRSPDLEEIAAESGTHHQLLGLFTNGWPLRSWRSWVSAPTSPGRRAGAVPRGRQSDDQPPPEVDRVGGTEPPSAGSERLTSPMTVRAELRKRRSAAFTRPMLDGTQHQDLAAVLTRHLNMGSRPLTPRSHPMPGQATPVACGRVDRVVTDGTRDGDLGHRHGWAAVAILCRGPRRTDA